MTISKDALLYQEEQKKIKAQIERKYKKTTEQLYAEREKRARDATELRVPDRVPLSVNAEPSKYTGVQRSAAYYDPIGWKRATRQVTVEFEPDMSNAGLPTSGAALEILGVTNRLWPGGPLPPDYEYQIEGVYADAHYQIQACYPGINWTEVREKRATWRTVVDAAC